MVLGDTGSTATGQGQGTGTQGGGQTTTTDGGQGTGTGTTTGGQASWRDSLPDDLKGHTGLQQFSDVQNLAKSWVHAQSQLGKKRVALPGEKATDEEYAAFYKELGVPELDKYEVKAPEGANPESVKSFREFVQKQGLLPKQSQAVLEWYHTMEKADIEKSQKAAQQAVTEGLTKLKSEWGQGYEKNIALGDMALREMGGDELIQHVVKTGLAKDPTFIKLMAKVGGVLGEDKLRGDAAQKFGGSTPAEIQKEIDQLTAKPEYMDASHAGHKRAVADVAELYKKLYG